ncbi:hypothetical protein GYH30_016956 [Glycine max]|uniref:Small ribosomal subunit protein uS10 domain-containing protein n=1 Tax=Glycine max TaxID=3847 RepID=I1KG35_SOYBN|nr:hypothetical protein GYH30_016956 [Glycine max]
MHSKSVTKIECNCFFYQERYSWPESRVLFTVLRSPHIDKKSREQFEMEIKKKFLIIKTQKHELRKKNKTSYSLAPSLILSFFLVVLSNGKSPMAIKGQLPKERIGLSAGIQILLAETGEKPNISII